MKLNSYKIVRAFLLVGLFCLSTLGFFFTQVFYAIITNSDQPLEAEDSNWLLILFAETYENLEENEKPDDFSNDGNSLNVQTTSSSLTTTCYQFNQNLSQRKGLRFLHLFMLYCSFRIAVF
jgi:hypothetical protein